MARPGVRKRASSIAPHPKSRARSKAPFLDARDRKHEAADVEDAVTQNDGDARQSLGSCWCAGASRSTRARSVKTTQNVRSAGAPCDAPFKAVHQFVVLLGVEVAVPIENDGYRRMARHDGDLFRVRAVGDPE
jgi:hypothetical protein